MRKNPIIVGNWKMNPQTIKEAQNLFLKIAKGALQQKKVTTIICPSYIHLGLFAQNKNKKTVLLGAQNFFYEEKGSFTGEVSLGMIVDAGARYAIIGLSERRKIGETDSIINKKILAALSQKITPIICIGEKDRDEEGNYYGFLKQQLEEDLQGVSRQNISKVIIAYEPIWAIGSSMAMDAHDIHGMTIFIKKTIMEMFRTKTPIEIPILYGGA
ncbi:MAG TPA: triose-phosphate isomerase, partial [Candidatus Babeliales bacterium]|nr:triose-phosphate isomerase [Candidatus Babeliales bacterium]